MNDLNHKTPQTSQMKNSQPQIILEKTKNRLTAKIIMLGDTAVGKTSLVQRFVRRIFRRSYKATLGLELSFYDVEVNENNVVRLQIWDVAGQSHYKAMRKRFYEGTAGAIMVYDVTRPLTFQNISLWMEELKENAGFVPFAVVGNKLDLVEMISTEEAEEAKWAEENGAITFYRTSAKTGKNVDLIFNDIAEGVVSIFEEEKKTRAIRIKNQ